jgi:hypothetical protein
MTAIVIEPRKVKLFRNGANQALRIAKRQAINSENQSTNARAFALGRLPLGKIAHKSVGVSCHSVSSVTTALLTSLQLAG